MKMRIDFSKITRNEVIKVSVYTFVAVAIFCPDVFGFDAGISEYGADHLKTEGEKIRKLIKPIMGISGAAGMGMGFIKAFQSSSMGPLLTWFGIGAGGLAGYGLLGSNMFSSLIPF